MFFKSNESIHSFILSHHTKLKRGKSRKKQPLFLFKGSASIFLLHIFTAKTTVFNKHYIMSIYHRVHNNFNCKITSQEVDSGLPFPYPCQKAVERGFGARARLRCGSAPSEKCHLGQATQSLQASMSSAVKIRTVLVPISLDYWEDRTRSCSQKAQQYVDRCGGR